MGNKIHPIAFRLGPVYTWTSRWFADKKRYQKLVLDDVRLRRSLATRLKPAGFARVEIERSINMVRLTIFVARPGVVIGRGGTGTEDLKKFVEKLLPNTKIDIKVESVKEPNLDAHLVAVNIADQLAKRLPAKRVLKQAIERVMTAGAKGVRVRLGGRIGGAEIARVEHEQAGILPLSSVKEKIDFATYPAHTRSGYVGIKVWICLS